MVLTGMKASPGFPNDWYDILATEHKSLNAHLEEDPVTENPSDYQ
jgi:hypothetical protein